MARQQYAKRMLRPPPPLHGHPPDQFNATLANFRTLKKDRLAESTASDTFEHYQEPKLDAFLRSEIDQPPPTNEVQYAASELRSFAAISENQPLPNEPTHRPEIHRVPPIPKRPAA